MAKMLGYMVTWTTYGTWLQGDERMWVKDGKVLEGNVGLYESNKASLKSERVKLNKQEQEIVRQAILKMACGLGQKIYALAVCLNHVHIVVGNFDEMIGKIVVRYKKVSTMALRKNGFSGKVWTKGYDKRYCLNEKALKARIEYVTRHEA